MVLIAGLHKVLHQCLNTKDDILEALELFYPMNERIHRTLSLGQFHRSILIPKGFITHLRVCLASFFGLSLEQLLGQLIKSIVSQSGCSYHKSP